MIGRRAGGRRTGSSWVISSLMRTCGAFCQGKAARIRNASWPAGVGTALGRAVELQAEAPLLQEQTRGGRNGLADGAGHVLATWCVDGAEVQVLGEAVGFEETLLQAGAAFEHPTFREVFVAVDAREHPSEDIVLLDDVWREGRLLGDREDFTLFDHVVSSRAQRWGTRSRHFVTTCDPS